MADVTENPPTAAETAETESSEAQIAVHWREEEYFEPPDAFAAQANASDPEILERFREERFPDSLRRVRGDARLGSQVGHDRRHQQPAVLQVVRGRAAERLRQLRGSASRDPG